MLSALTCPLVDATVTVLSVFCSPAMKLEMTTADAQTRFYVETKVLDSSFGLKAVWTLSYNSQDGLELKYKMSTIGFTSVITEAESDSTDRTIIYISVHGWSKQDKVPTSQIQTHVLSIDRPMLYHWAKLAPQDHTERFNPIHKSIISKPLPSSYVTV